MRSGHNWNAVQRPEDVQRQIALGHQTGDGRHFAVIDWRVAKVEGHNLRWNLP